MTRQSPQAEGNAIAQPSDSAPLDELMSEILAALGSRTDGVPLGYAWLQYLIWSGHAHGRWRSQPRTAKAPPTLLLEVLSRIGAWLPLHSTPEQWVADEDYVWRNDRIYSLLAVFASREPVDVPRLHHLITALVTRDLVSTVGIERLATDTTSHARHIVAAAIAAIPDPAKWIKELWATIFRLRDRARRYRSGNDVPPNLGQVVVFWGLCGLGQLEFTSQPARELWVALELAARESSLTDAVRLHDDPWSVALRWLAAYWPRLFPDDPPTGSPGSLDDFLSYLAAPDMIFAALALELFNAGVTAAQLRRSIPDPNLLRRGADDLKRVTRRAPQSDTAKAIEALAFKIDALSP